MLAELERHRPTLFDASGGEPTLVDARGAKPTLDEVLASIWEGLTAHQTAACPVCGGAMEPEYGVHALPVGGRCGACGSSLR